MKNKLSNSFSTRSFSRKFAFPKKAAFSKFTRRNSDSIDESQEESRHDGERSDSQVSKRNFFVIHTAKNKVIQLKDKFKEKITKEEAVHNSDQL